MTSAPRPGDDPPQVRGSAGAPPDARRAPLAGGTALGTAVLVLLAAAAAHLEGGADPDQRRTNAYAQAVVFLVAAGVLGFYARRVLLCAFEDDRPVPWFRDERDARPWTSDVGAFVAVAVLSFLPLLAWTALRRAVEAPAWASVAVNSASLVYATAVFPFAHAAAVLRGTVLAGTPSVALRAIRAAPTAARAAIRPTFFFLALLAVSAVMSGWFTPPPGGSVVVEDHTTGRDALRVAVFVVRSAAVWAALVSFRAAGVLAREAPEVGEVLR
jgi:hypothetical protein